MTCLTQALEEGTYISFHCLHIHIQTPYQVQRPISLPNLADHTCLLGSTHIHCVDTRNAPWSVSVPTYNDDDRLHASLTRT